MGMARYFQHAFTNRWNLLAFCGAVGFGVLSAPTVVLPLVLAGELTYLGLLGSHPRFQRYVDAQLAKSLQEEGQSQNVAALQRILQSLPKESLQRFEALRACCVELQQIAAGMKNPGGSSTRPLEDLQLGRLDRLMWMFLRLLYTEFSLMRFLHRTNAQDITREIDKLEKRLAGLANTRDSQQQRVRKALEDNLATCRERQANVQKAMDNLQLVRLELDRLENKIRSLNEVAINREEPQYISEQVDQVATSLLETEKTMNDLQFATGLETIEDAVPSLLRGMPPLPVKHKIAQ